MSGFEGSYLGHGDRIDPATPMECGVCWWVYEPALGDDHWHIEPGVAFADLPSHWRCPECDAAQHQFMVYGVGNASMAAAAGQAARLQGSTAAASRQALKDEALTEGLTEALTEAATADEVLRRRLRAAYMAVAERMRSLPVYNACLQVDVGRFIAVEDGWVSVVITPWCMNLLRLSFAPERLPREGSQQEHVFPSGSYTFTVAHLDGVGRFEACSLFSPMAEFEQMAVARTVAAHALRNLFAAPDLGTQGAARTTAAPTVQEEIAAPTVSRRVLLGGQRPVPVR